MRSTSFDPTYTDLLAAYRLNHRAFVRSRRIARTYIVGAIGLGAFAAVISWACDIASFWVGGLAGAAYWIVLFTAVMFVAYLRLPRRIRRIYDQQKSLHATTTVDWSERGIAFRSARGHAQFDWIDFIEVVTDPDTIILRQSEALLSFVPTRILTDEQRADLLAVATAARAA